MKHRIHVKQKYSKYGLMTVQYDMTGYDIFLCTQMMTRWPA